MRCWRPASASSPQGRSRPPEKKPRLIPEAHNDAFADPGESAPLTHLAVEAGSYHLLALSREARRVGALHLPTGQWSWKHKISQQPLLLASHPVTGEGYLVWSEGSESGLTRFRITTGEPITTVPLGAIPADQFRAVALDTERNRLYIATAHGILGVDLTRNRPTPRLAWEGAVDMAVDAPDRKSVV